MTVYLAPEGAMRATRYGDILAAPGPDGDIVMSYSSAVEHISFGDFVLLPLPRLLYRRGEPIRLGSRKFDILRLLVERAGQVVSHRELISAAWRGLVVDYGNLRVQITGLRQALGDGEAGARYIANIPGQGYCFVAPTVTDSATHCYPRSIDMRVGNLGEALAHVEFSPFANRLG